tara:strand:- start:693 stop:1160 length:468 start_codon:yes stop_codon:yes gene_type:complete
MANWFSNLFGGDDEELTGPDLTVQQARTEGTLFKGTTKKTENGQKVEQPAPGESLLDKSKEWGKTEDFKNADRISKEKLKEARQKAKEEGRQLTPEEIRNIGSPIQYANDKWQKRLVPLMSKARGGKVKKKKKAKKGYSKKYSNGGTIRKPRRSY